MKKRTNTTSIFKKNYYQRFFKLDHAVREMRIYHDHSLMSKYVSYNYHDILHVEVPILLSEDLLGSASKWSFTFRIVLQQRDYILYAPTLNEYQRWLHSFKWIVEMNMFYNFCLRSKGFKKWIKALQEHFCKLNIDQKLSITSRPQQLVSILI